MRKTTLTAAALAAIFLLFGAGNANAFDITKNANYQGLLKATDAADAARLLGGCLAACNNSVVDKETADGKAAVDSCKKECNTAFASRKAEATTTVADDTKPGRKPGVVATDLCKDFECQAEGVCRADKVDGKRTPVCHCPDGTFGTHCEKRCAAPITTYVCPVLADNTGKIEWQNSAAPCDMTSIGTLITNLKKASGAGWWWWLIIIILSLVILVLLYFVLKLKRERDAYAKFLTISGQDPKKVLLQAQEARRLEKEKTRRVSPPPPPNR
jgi:hypothetical protein